MMLKLIYMPDSPQVSFRPKDFASKFLATQKQDAAKVFFKKL